MSNYNIEAIRRHTFDVNWSIPFSNKDLMARTGLYALANGESVKCHFCKLEVSNWSEGDNIVAKHARVNPECTILNQRASDNIPIDSRKLNEVLQSLSYDIDSPGFLSLMQYAKHKDDVDGLEIIHILSQMQPMTKENLIPNASDPCTLSQLHEADNNSIESQNTSDKPVGFFPARSQNNKNDSVAKTVPIDSRLALWYTDDEPRYPEYEDVKQRFKSFATWDEERIYIEVFVMAGFFSVGVGDKVACFHCGLRLKDWGEYNDPWLHHAAWSPACHYVLEMKGEDFVKSVESDKNCVAAINDLWERSSSPIPQWTQQSRTCKVCLQDKLGAVFLPCGHAATCRTCARILNFSTRKCPICRKKFLIYHDIYFP